MQAAEFAYALSLLLLALNVGQWVFWTKEIKRLVDRLMSRNYAEFTQAELMKSGSIETGKSESKAEVVDDGEVLDELNKMFGMRN